MLASQLTNDLFALHDSQDIDALAQMRYTQKELEKYLNPEVLAGFEIVEE